MVRTSFRVEAVIKALSTYLTTAGSKVNGILFIARGRSLASTRLVGRVRDTVHACFAFGLFGNGGNRILG